VSGSDPKKSVESLLIRIRNIAIRFVQYMEECYRYRLRLIFTRTLNERQLAPPPQQKKLRLKTLRKKLLFVELDTSVWIQDTNQSFITGKKVISQNLMKKCFLVKLKF
jgi:hypothetical protein